MNVVVVESPAKAKTIQKYLGPGYEVLASYGHVRDLPSKDGSVRPDDDFSMDWDVDAKSAKRLKDIADAVKGSKKLILATDPDREGEAISWHVLEVLRKKGVLKSVAVERVAFNAITRQSVQDALAHPRAIDQELVDAYLARRALDYLVGFSLSPVLWRKLPGSRSAGRVQSVALRLVCDRELEIEQFVSQEYWTIEANCLSARNEPFIARLTELNGEKLKKFDLADQAAASRAREIVLVGSPRVRSVEKKPAKRHPPPPFTTSTLQQEAARKLGFSASRTMQVAQRLYEGVDIGGETVGLITYMRTDGVQVSPEALQAARTHIGERFGARYVPGAPRLYKTKAKNAQEAHEAIRPTDPKRGPDSLRGLESDQIRLYELIWKRMLASQMESADLERTTADIETAAGQAILRASGTVILFDGFLALYQEGEDEAGADDESRRLPQLSTGESVKLVDVLPQQHFTEPPPRYTEATLVKRLEELGIGRPSTYASILSVLRDRSYVRMEKNRFFPEDKGRIVTAFLESFFKRYVEYDFTAGLEEQLDLVSDGKLDWKALLRDFWRDFTAALDGISGLKITDVINALDEVLGPHLFVPVEGGGDPRTCPACANGRLNLKLGRFGAFIGCSNYPECRYTRRLSPAEETPGQLNEPKLLGEDPETGQPITLRSGRFGIYVQRGDGEKPKRAGVPKDIPPDEVDLERALKLLSLPRAIGTHPETNEPITANLGRYGPYIQHQGKYANLDSTEDVFSIGINRAVTLLAEKAAKGNRFAAPAALKELGAHPGDGAPIKIMKGRYGPYVSHGGINATVPKDKSPETLTLSEALKLLEERASSKPSKKQKKTAAPKAVARNSKAMPKAKTPANKTTHTKKTPKKKPKKQAAE